MIFGWQIVRVEGESMSPCLENGDYIVVKKKPISLGDVVLIEHSSLGLIVKRIHTKNADGRFLVAGDNPASTSSEKIGLVASRSILGTARLRISPRGVSCI